MPEYQYGIYNPGQYPGEIQAQFDAMSAAGWHVHTALPNYNEVCILWERSGSALANKLAAHLEEPPRLASAAPPEDKAELAVAAEPADEPAREEPAQPEPEAGDVPAGD